jgi:hypothetical protein
MDPKCEISSFDIDFEVFVFQDFIFTSIYYGFPDLQVFLRTREMFLAMDQKEEFVF